MAVDGVHFAEAGVTSDVPRAHYLGCCYFVFISTTCKTVSWTALLYVFLQVIA